MTRLWIKLWISGFTVCSVALGITIISIGNHRAAQDYYYNVLPFGAWGAFFIALPAITLAIVATAAIARAAAAEHQRYRAWKASLPSEQRVAVELVEVAAMTAAAVAMHERHKRVDARLTESVMGRAPLNRAHVGIMAGTARLNATRQATQREQTDSCPPTRK